MPRKIVDMNIEEVSGVDKAANGRRFLIVKRAEPLDINPMQKLWSFAKGLFVSEETMSDDLEKAGKKISGGRMETLKQTRAMLDQIIAEAEPVDPEPEPNPKPKPTPAPNLDPKADPEPKPEPGPAIPDKKKEGMMKGSVMMPITDEIRKNLPEEVQNYLADIEKKAEQVEGLTAKVEDLEKKLNPNPPAEDIWKGVNPEVRKRMEDMEKKAKDAEDLAKRLQEEAEDNKRFVKAANLAVPGTKPEEIAVMMKSLAGNPEALEKFEAMLTSTKEQVEKGALFAEFGRTGGAPAAGGTAVAKVETMASEMVQKSANGMTKEQALAKVWSEHPELYDEYEAEMASK